MVTVLAASTPHHHAHAGEVVGWVLVAIVCLGIWIALAHWPARVAQDKGYSFQRYLIYGLICFPVALVSAYLLRDRHQPHEHHQPVYR